MADPDDAPTSEPTELERLERENERLKAQVDTLESEVATASQGTAPRSRRKVGRWTASWVLIVVGSMLVPVSVLSVWLDRTITDTDRYVETVAPLIRDHDIQVAIQRRIEQALYQRVDLQAEVQSLLPDRAAMLAGPITAGVRNLVSDLIERVITSDKVAKLWDDANRIAHQQVVDVLTVSNGKKGVVTLDLTDLVKQVQARLVSAGVPFLGNLTVPAVKLDVLQSDTIAQVQSAFNLFNKLATILPWLTFIVLGAGILAAPDRRKGFVRAASGWVIGSALLLVGIAIGRQVYMGALPSGASVPANETFFLTITRFLRGGGRMVLVVGLVLLIAALVTGPSGPAVRLRAALARLFGAAGSGVGRTGVDLGPVPAFVGRNLMALRVVVAVVALGAFLLLGQPSAGAVFWIAALAVVALAILEILGRSGRVGPEGAAMPAAATTTGTQVPVAASDESGDAQSPGSSAVT